MQIAFGLRHVGTAIALAPLTDPATFAERATEGLGMLRITTDESPRVMTLRLEGRLEGPWVAVLADCWSGALADCGGRRLCIDLNGVTFIDEAGKARLAEMHEQGAEFITDDLETEAIVAEIVRR